jgi:hypothetical protein
MAPSQAQIGAANTIVKMSSRWSRVVLALLGSAMSRKVVNSQFFGSSQIGAEWRI